MREEMPWLIHVDDLYFLPKHSNIQILPFLLDFIDLAGIMDHVTSKILTKTINYIKS